MAEDPAKTHVTGDDLIETEPDDCLIGTHSLNGIWAIMGPAFNSNRRIDAEIIDIAPTIAAAFGLPVSSDIDGVVIKEAFVAPPDIGYESTASEKEQKAHVYSPQEQQEISSRLKDLGYFE